MSVEVTVQPTKSSAPSFFDIDELPERVYLLRIGSKWGAWCLKKRGIRGLAAFQHEGQAERFKEMLTGRITIEEMEFDCAREIARNRPQMHAVFIMDHSWDNPRIHFVR